MRVESSGKPDAWKLARPVWGWGRGETPRPTPRSGAGQPGETMHASSQGNLCGGESEEAFTERLSLAVWRANGGYCNVTVIATYLENLPYESHTLDKSDYDRLIQDNTGRSEK